MDCLTYEIRKQASWQMISAGDSVLCACDKSKLEEDLDLRKEALE